MKIPGRVQCDAETRTEADRNESLLRQEINGTNDTTIYLYLLPSNYVNVTHFSIKCTAQVHNKRRRRGEGRWQFGESEKDKKELITG